MSGDELFRPARVIRKPQEPRARVIGSDLFTPMFEGPRVIGPQEFIEEFRRRVGMKPGEPLYGTDFGEAGRNYPALIPILIYNPGAHWIIVREMKPTSMEAYDPATGLREIGHPDGKFWYLQHDPTLKGEYNFSILRSPEFAIVDRYLLPREPLARLGPILRDPLNCGPLAVYAALVAKGHIKSP